MSIVDRKLSVSGDVAMKAPARVASTGALTLSGLQTIDGVAVVEDERILVKDQGVSAENGVYNASSGNWVRTADFDGAFDIVSGTRILVIDGTANGNTEWYVSTPDPISIDSTALAFAAGPTGQVQGPGVTVDNELPLFSGTTGNLFKSSTGTGPVEVTAGVVSIGAETGDEVGARLDTHIAEAVTDSDTGTSGANKVLLLDGSGNLPALNAGSLLGIYPRRAYADTKARIAITGTPFPTDDTIPQITEGTEILSVDFAPTSVTSRLRIIAHVVGGVTAAANGCMALFDGNSDAIAGAGIEQHPYSATPSTDANIVYEYVPGVTATLTFSLRVGRSSGTFYLNEGNPGTNRYGAIMVSSIIVEEVA